MPKGAHTTEGDPKGIALVSFPAFSFQSFGMCGIMVTPNQGYALTQPPLSTQGKPEM